MTDARRYSLLLVLCAWFSTGCTLIGLGIGSATPRRPVFEGPFFDAPIGSTVTAYLVSPPRYPDRLCGKVDLKGEPTPRIACESPITTRVVTGEFRGSDGRYLWFERDEGMIGIERADVDHLTRETSYWATGAIAGAVLDLIALVAVNVAIQHEVAAHAGEN